MYTRSYPERGGGVLPEGYSGSAIREEREDELPRTEAENKNPWETDDVAEPVSAEAKRDPLGLLGGGFISELFHGGRLNLRAIGFEEILIIAAAAYMLISRDGDRECGVMLLILLLI